MIVKEVILRYLSQNVHNPLTLLQELKTGSCSPFGQSSVYTIQAGDKDIKHESPEGLALR